MRDLPYEERLCRLGITTLKERRERGDMIQVFKILKGIDKMNKQDLFPLSPEEEQHPQTRGHRYKITKKGSKTTARQQFFSQRAVNPWNGLPPWVVEAESTNQFKNLYDKSKDMGHYRRKPSS